MRILGIAPLALGLALLMTPTLDAQGTRVTVCQDGTTTTDVGRYACVDHGGVNTNAMRRGRRGRGARGSAQHIQCPDGSVSSGGLHGCDGASGTNAATGIVCADGTVSTNGLHGCTGRGGVAGDQRQGNNRRAYGDRDDSYGSGQVTGGTEGRANRDRRSASAGMTARCADGTYTRARRNVCAQHGGVATWLRTNQ